MADTNPALEKDLEYGSSKEAHTGVMDDKSLPAYDDNMHHGSVTNPAEVEKARHIQNAWAPFRYMSMGEQWLDDKLGVETQGIDRIPEEEKRPPSLINVFFIWWSMTCHVGTLPIGILGMSCDVYAAAFYTNVASSSRVWSHAWSVSILHYHWYLIRCCVHGLYWYSGA